MSRPPQADLLDQLTDISLNDLLQSTGLPWLKHTPPKTLFRPAASRFAKVVHEFDCRVGSAGLASGSQWLLHQLTGGWQVSGAHQVPATGPVIILANHPGMTDTVALFASLAFRPDLKIMALDQPFLRALPQVAKQLIFVPEDEAGRLAVVRAGARHLKQGGALLTFPAGQIEPDPALFAREARASLQNWSESHALIARLVPQVCLLPAIVSNVLSAEALRHPLTRCRRGQHDQEKMAAALQVMFKAFQGGTVKVAFGAPISASGAEPQALTQAVLERAGHLMESLDRSPPDRLCVMGSFNKESS